MKTRSKSKIYDWLACRERGSGVRGSPAWRGGPRDDLRQTLYSNINYAGKYDGMGYGAVFNVDFSPDGSMCVGAMESCAVQVMDPHNSQLITFRAKAHTDCVNCVRFLDSRMFVTCSDDTNVCIWDVRNLKQQVQVLTGHSNWVKNIEYAQQSRQLLTSGFDGSVYLWDLNSSENDNKRQCVFHTEGLMRSKLVPDSSQLVISTRYGYLMLVHDLDLNTLKEDLQGFKPTSYRLWKEGRALSSGDLSYEHVFTRRRNRVELIDDFMPDFEAEMIASLEVHPRGWCVLSRLVNKDNNRELTSVHDIQSVVRGWQVLPERKRKCRSPYPLDLSSSDDSDDPDKESIESTTIDDDYSLSSISTVYVDSSVDEDLIPLNDESQSPPGAGTSHGGEQTSGTRQYEANRPRFQFFLSTSSRRRRMRSSFPDVDTTPETSQQASEPPTASHVPDFNSSDFFDPGTKTLCSWNKNSNTVLPPRENHTAEGLFLKPSHFEYRRLLMYLDEPNVGRGYIKEQSFSADGRVIASPFGHGLRLLAFDEKCSELRDCEPENAPVELTEILQRSLYHQNDVLTTKFSPQGYLLASGCLDGKINFLQPKF